MPTKLKVNKIPTLLFLSGDFEKKINLDDIQLESIAYEEDTLSMENLLNFILFNSKNPLTLLNFFKNNFNDAVNLEKREQEKLRMILKNIVLANLKNLENKSEVLADKLLSLDDRFNKKHFNKKIKNSQFHMSHNDSVYFSNIPNHLTVQLDQCLNKIEILRSIKKMLSF